MLVRHIEAVCKRIYHLLTIDGYARLDLRLTANNEVYFIEANPNPILAPDEDFAQSAFEGGLGLPAIDRPHRPPWFEHGAGLSARRLRLG